MITTVTATALIFTQSFAATGSMVSKKTATVTAFEKIIVGENVTVMLVQEDEKIVTVEGDAAYLNNISLGAGNGVLTIKSTNKNTAAKTVVYITAKNLKAIEVLGNSKIMTAEEINTPNLVVTVNTECTLGLQTSGMITLRHPEDIDLNFLKIKNNKKLKTEIM